MVGLDLKGADLEVDVRDEDAVASAVDGVVARHGRLDAVLNAAGVAGGGPVASARRRRVGPRCSGST